MLIVNHFQDFIFMPMYDYHCASCDTTFEKNVKMAEYLSPQECPNCAAQAERTVGGYAPSIGDSVRLGLTKPPEVFRDLLRNMADKYPGAKTMRNNSSYI